MYSDTTTKSLSEGKEGVNKLAMIVALGWVRWDGVELANDCVRPHSG